MFTACHADDGTRDSGGVLGAMMQNQEVLGLQWKLSVRLALIVGEFNFVRTVEEFYNSADLSPKETVRR